MDEGRGCFLLLCKPTSSTSIILFVIHDSPYKSLIADPQVLFFSLFLTKIKVWVYINYSGFLSEVQGT